MAHSQNKTSYKMDHKNRGYAVIIDNWKFNDRESYPSLEGHNVDVVNWKKTFKNLGFVETEIIYKENQSKDQMLKIMTKYAKENYDECDCFIGVFLSHGCRINDKQFIMGIDENASLEDLIGNFKYNKSLQDKPKIFFVDACRKEEIIEKGTPFTDKDKIHDSFFIGYATVSGKNTSHSYSQGSYYSTILCETFNKNYTDNEEMNLENMVTEAQNNLIVKYERKIIAEHTHSLRWPCYFKRVAENNYSQSTQQESQSFNIPSIFNDSRYMFSKQKNQNHLKISSIGNDQVLLPKKRLMELESRCATIENQIKEFGGKLPSNTGKEVAAFDKGVIERLAENFTGLVMDCNEKLDGAIEKLDGLVMDCNEKLDGLVMDCNEKLDGAIEKSIDVFGNAKIEPAELINYIALTLPPVAAIESLIISYRYFKAKITYSSS